MNEQSPELPSLKSLFLSTLFALSLAAILLVFAVLPAEYGIDPTGFGKTTGLLTLAPSKSSSPDIQVEQNCVSDKDISIRELDPKMVEAELSNYWRDTVTVIVPPLGGREYKFFLEKDAELGFEWQTDDGTKLYFDFHGEPKGDTSGYFKSFKIETADRSSGTLKAPFAGSHGWYWENKTAVPVKVVLRTKGNYRVLGVM